MSKQETSLEVSVKLSIDWMIIATIITVCVGSLAVHFFGCDKGLVCKISKLILLTNLISTIVSSVLVSFSDAKGTLGSWIVNRLFKK